MSEKLSQIKDLKPGMKGINVLVKVVSLGEEREVTSRRDMSRHRVAQVLIGDSTATINLTLWDDKIDLVEEGKSYSVKNAYTKVFRGSMTLNLGRYGELTESEEEVGDVNTELNMSEKVFEESRGFGSRQRRYRRL